MDERDRAFLSPLRSPFDRKQYSTFSQKELDGMRAILEKWHGVEFVEPATLVYIPIPDPDTLRSVVADPYVEDAFEDSMWLVDRLEEPIILDRFGSDDGARDAWRDEMVGRYGILFNEVWIEHKLTSSSLTHVIGALDGLVDAIDQSGVAIPVGVRILQEYRVLSQRAIKPYSKSSLDEKLTLARQCDTSALAALEAIYGIAHTRATLIA